MLQVDLSTLAGPELRQLLDSTRKRGQARLTYEILQEMAARRERGGVPSPEPRVIAVDFRDPLDRDEEVYDEPAPDQMADAVADEGMRLEPRDEAQYEAADEMSDEADEAPLYLVHNEPRGKAKRAAPRAAPPAPSAANSLPEDTFPDDPFIAGSGRKPRRKEKAEKDDVFAHAPPHRAPPRRRALWVTVGFAFGMAAEAGLAWWVGVPGFPHRPAAAATRGAPMKPAQVAQATLPPAAPRILPPDPPGDVPLPVEGTADPAGASSTALGPGPGSAPVPAAVPAAAEKPAPAPKATVLAAASPPPPIPASKGAEAEAASDLAPPPDLPPAKTAAQARLDARAEARAEARAKAREKLAAETPEETDEAPPANTVKLAAAGPKGCDAQSTPADRTICGDAHLQRLQHELRAAYAQALQVHQDRDLLRQRQLAWADSRNGVSDAAALARLYEERVKRLKAATEAAKRDR